MKTNILRIYVLFAVTSLLILLGSCDPANRMYFKNTFGDEVQVVITTINNQYKETGLKPNDEFTFFIMLGFYSDEEINWEILSTQIQSIQVFDMKGKTIIDLNAKEGKLDSTKLKLVQISEGNTIRNILVVQNK